VSFSCYQSVVEPPPLKDPPLLIPLSEVLDELGVKTESLDLFLFISSLDKFVDELKLVDFLLLELEVE
jgi:hypothetical protein